jgi:hypothetical protein
MKEEKKYRVFSDNDHEYDILVNENEKGYSIYNLIRTGSSWSEHVRDKSVCEIVNDGNGYHLPDIKKFMDYAKVMELQTLLLFVSWYETKDSSNSSVITIESCKEKLRFSI